MTATNRWQVVLVGLTVALLACEQSITDVPLPEAEAAPQVEAVTSVALMAHGVCAPLNLLPPLISWWSGDDTFADIAKPLAAANDVGVNSQNGVRPDPALPFDRLDEGDVTFGSGLVGKAFKFTAMPGNLEADAQFLEIPDASDLQPANFTVDLWTMRTGEGQNKDPFGSVLIQKDAGGTASSYSIWWRDDGRILARVTFGGTKSPRRNSFRFQMGLADAIV